MSKFKIGDMVRFNPASVKVWKTMNRWYEVHGLTAETIENYTTSIIKLIGDDFLIQIKRPTGSDYWNFSAKDIVHAYELVGPELPPVLAKIKYLNDRYANRTKQHA
jgi:hypothetical protein